VARQGHREAKNAGNRFPLASLRPRREKWDFAVTEVAEAAVVFFIAESPFF
jgi:hypothetical protein